MNDEEREINFNDLKLEIVQADKPLSDVPQHGTVTITQGVNMSEVRCFLVQDDQRIELPIPTEISLFGGGLVGRSSVKIIFANGELNWMGPEPILKMDKIA